MDLITLVNVTKRYDKNTILDHVNQTIVTGRSIAFMGHNGCGKSTLLRIIAGLTAPTAGKVLWRRPLLFHYVPEKFAPAPLTARGYLRSMGRLDGMGKTEIRDRMLGLSRDFFLEELLDIPMKNLSKGTLQKIGVIQALMKQPDVLLLDEPLSGQDEASQDVFIRKLNELRQQGVTVIMACHEQRLADAVAEITYTIRDGVLSLYRSSDEKRNVLILNNACGRKLREGMERFGDCYKLAVPETQVQKLLLELLADGWELRRMSDE